MVKKFDLSSHKLVDIGDKAHQPKSLVFPKRKCMIMYVVYRTRIFMGYIPYAFDTYHMRIWYVFLYVPYAYGCTVPVYVSHFL